MNSGTTIISIFLALTLVSKARADSEYYMKIGSDWELGKIVASADGKQQKFVTCPGGRLYPLDQRNLKKSAIPCPDGGGSGVFDATVLDVDNMKGEVTIKYLNDTKYVWSIPSLAVSDSAWKKLAPGTPIYLDVIDKNKKQAVPYLYEKNW